MSRPLKFSKVSEMEDQEDTDMISRLPDELLGYMLSFLLTKSAVGTSILSSRWRYLHMLTNCLSFKAPFEVRQKKAFKKFVNRVLLLHKASSIEKFSLDCGQHVFDDLDLHTWVTVAISKGVEQLHLSFNGQLKALPHCLFSSPKLVELKLTCIRGIQVPKSIDLPNLKILHLRAIKFRCTGSFQKLFSACSLLQELEVVHCEWPTYLYTSNHLCISSRKLKRLTINSLWADFEVDAPNLAYLHYTKDDEHIALSLRNSSCLITAILDLHFTDSDLIQPVALALIKAVGHAKELQLLGETSEYLTCFMDDHIPSYPNMVNLRLGYCTDATWKYVVHWLANSPRLETLIFEQVRA
ncbi:hypothetical protein RND81_07G106600 [Saponaria officinalis]|uniref:F-box domain-containing protein n=1 Tax=Saponaria officinalis TaxID=3572 RepID=A0AAW1JQG1_SAPOF